MKTLLCCLSIVLAQTADAAAERTILFVDDHDILYSAGTKRLLHPPAKHPLNPLITEEKPWELAIGWTSVQRAPATGKYQLWYQAYAGDRAPDATLRSTVCYAESEDGLHFTKPALGLFTFRGEPTNIVLVGAGIYGDRYANSVIVDPRDPDPARRYKMAYSDFAQDTQGNMRGGLHVAFSPDGIHWTKYPEAPLLDMFFGSKKAQPPFTGESPYVALPQPNGVIRRGARLPMTMSDAADVIYDPRHEAFVLYGKMWIAGPDGGLGWKHGLGRTESKDFLHWSRPQLVCAPNEEDGALEFHTSPVFQHRERYFSLSQILNRADHGMMDVELMVSRDGFEWERPFRSPFFIARSPGQQFDSGTLLSNSSFLIAGDEMRFYYGAYSSGAIGGGQDILGDQQKSGVGLATLPLDRFAGLRSAPGPATDKAPRPPEIGQITLKPLDLTGREHIFVNANAVEGAVRGELLDEDGFRVPGFDQASCAPLKADALRFPLLWQDRHLRDLPPGRYHLRLHLQHAEVFAITLQ